MTPTPLAKVRNPHAAAILDAINARWSQLATPRAAFEIDDAAQSGLTNYGHISLGRRDGGNVRLGGVVSPSLWRLSLRAVGDSVSNVRVMLDAATEALEFQTITVAGVTSTPIAFELEDETRQDDTDKNLWSGLTQWIYAF